MWPPSCEICGLFPELPWILKSTDIQVHTFGPPNLPNMTRGATHLDNDQMTGEAAEGFPKPQNDLKVFETMRVKYLAPFL